jgi:RNA polymerase sigma-70 factor (ECF subfamily)
MNNKLMEDSEIIDLCLRGETDAFEMIVNKYQANLLSVAWSVLGSREDAKDVTQEAFLQALAHLQRFDTARSFKNWLYVIVYNQCLDRKRKEKSLRKFIKRTEKEIGFSDPGDDSSRRIEDSKAFSPLLSKLKEKERLALSLKINDGYSAAEIAEILQCSQSSVRVYVFNAIRKLRASWARRIHV